MLKNVSRHSGAVRWTFCLKEIAEKAEPNLKQQKHIPEARMDMTE